MLALGNQPVNAYGYLLLDQSPPTCEGKSHRRITIWRREYKMDVQSGFITICAFLKERRLLEVDTVSSFSLFSHPWSSNLFRSFLGEQLGSISAFTLIINSKYKLHSHCIIVVKLWDRIEKIFNIHLCAAFLHNMYDIALHNFLSFINLYTVFLLQPLPVASSNLYAEAC